MILLRSTENTLHFSSSSPYASFMKQNKVKSLLLQHNTLRDQNTVLYGTMPGNEEMPNKHKDFIWYCWWKQLVLQ